MLSRVAKRQLHLKSFDKRVIALSDLVPDDSEKVVKFRNLFLRDACPSRVDPSTHQKDFSTGQLNEDVAPNSAQVTGNSTLKVEWNDGQVSEYSKTLLQRYCTPQSKLEFRQLSPLETWSGKPDLSQVFSVPFSDYMNSKFAFSETLKQLHKDGLVFITGVPKQETEQVPVEDIAEKVGYIKNTFYGKSWNVESVPDAKNVAYTSVYLPLHMDLLYYESPPGIQLLHVVDNKAEGGESVFADSFAAAQHVKDNDPDAYHALQNVPITFHYLHESDHYYYQRPLIVEKYGRIDHVNYAPPFQGPLDSMVTESDLSDDQLSDFIRGLKMFEKYIEDPKHQLEQHTPEGTCMVFMNRRVLHGRREFRLSGGKRFFKGTYLDIDAFYSKLRTAT